jgi:hypothetical protein
MCKKEKTTFKNELPITFEFQYVIEKRENKITFHYNNQLVLKKTTKSSCIENFQKQFITKEYFYEDEDEICAFYFQEKIVHYTKTIQLKGKRVIEHTKNDKNPFEKKEFYYNDDLLRTLINLAMPNRIMTSI